MIEHEARCDKFGASSVSEEVLWFDVPRERELDRLEA
jgi:hypothetical protein